MSSYMFPLRLQNSSYTESESEPAVLEEISAKASFDSHLLNKASFRKRVMPSMNNLLKIMMSTEFEAASIARPALD